MANKRIRQRSPGRRLSRQESKLVTRQRLLRAGIEVLAEQGYERLTTGRVARRAGVAQPTFYVHFRDRDELLQAIAADVVATMRTALREVRLQVGQGGDVLELTRASFRLPLSILAERHGDLLRLFVSELHRPSSAIGRSARALIGEVTRDLVEDLGTLGIAGPVPPKRLALLCDAIIMLTVHLGMAYVEGREHDLDAIADLLAHTTVCLLLGSATAPPPAHLTSGRRGRGS